MGQIHGANLGSPAADVNSEGRLLVSAEISGNIIIGSVSATVDSIYVQSGNNMHLGSAWTNIGSVLVTNPSEIGSLGVQTISGTVEIGTDPVPVSGIVNQGTDPWITLGSGAITNFGALGSDRTGSFAITTTVLPVSGTLFQDVLGSQAITNFGVLGSDRTVSNRVAGSIVDMPDINIAAGSVYQLSTPGSVAIYGDISTSNPSVGEIGSPHLGSATVIAGDWGGSNAVIRMDTGSWALVAGSISSLPDVNVSTGSVRIVSLADTVRQIDAGSVYQLSSPGSHEIYGTLSVTNPSVAEEGTAHLGSATLIGADFNGSIVNLLSTAGSELITTGSVRQLGAWNIDTGSIRIVSQADVDRTVSNRVAGSIVNLPDVNIAAGSIRLLSTTGSMEVFQTANADMQVQATQEGTWDITNLSTGSVRIVSQADTDRVVTAGSVRVVSLADTVRQISAGSVYQVSSPGSHEIFGTLSVTNPSVAEEGTAHLGSATLIGGDFNGSIVNFLATAGSELLITGSVSQNTDPWIVLGSTRMIPGDNVTVDQSSTTRQITAGSVVILSHTGSLEVFQVANADMQVQATQEGTWDVNNLTTGSVRIVSQADTDRVVTAGSVRIVSLADTVRQIDAGSVYQLSSPGSHEIFGTLSVTNPSVAEEGTPHLGSATLIGADFNGSIVNLIVSAGSELIITGSVSQNTDPWVVLGSTRMIPGDNLTVVQDATTRQITAGSTILLSNNGSIPVWNVAGSIQNYNPIGVGSVVISGTSIPPFRGIGSVRLTPGSLEVYQTAGADMVVNQGTDPWITLGSTRMIPGDRVPGSIVNLPDVNIAAGSVTITEISAGSVEVFQTTADDLDVNISAFPLFDLGSPGFKQVTQLTSGTFNSIWDPGPGSTLEIHGFEISSHVAQMVRLVISGAAYTVLSRFRMPASGTVMKSFIHPITPLAADQELGIGTTLAGSTDVTIYGRDKA